MSTEASATTGLIHGLEHLALQVVMLEDQDLEALGAFLRQLDLLRELVNESRDPEPARLLGHLAEVARRLVLEEIGALTAAQEFLSQGTTLLLEWAQKEQFPNRGEAWESYCRLLGELDLERLEEAGLPLEGSEFVLEDPELVAGFLAEAQEHLEGIETHLMHLEKTPDDLELINAIFRPFHTIKGVAGFLKLGQIQDLCHEVETLLDRARQGELLVTAGLIDLILLVVDLLREMLADLDGVLREPRSPKEFDLGPALFRIKALQHGEGETPDTSQAPQEKVTGAESPFLEEPAPSAPAPHLPAQPEAIFPEIGQEAPFSSHQRSRKQETRPDKGTPDTTLKVSLAKVDNLVDLMGELVITQSQVRQNPLVTGLTDPKLEQDLAQMGRITLELQKISMSMRMIPLGQTFRKMERLVRDLARKIGKSVDLHLEGEDTGMDRTMVETIHDPLVHLVRNAVDHGLETPAAREEAGKPAAGQVWLRAYHKGGNVYIEVADDGRGLDRARILAKAQERGLVLPDATLTPTQIDHFLFEPGFSTASQVTEVSGRGVGLDVVRQAIERLQGKIEVHSRLGKGCRFTLRLPLTLAIMDGLVVRIGPERYIIPATAVREILRPSQDDYFTVQGQGEIIRVRDQLIPLMRLHRFLGRGINGVSPMKALVMVVEHESESRCLLVDDILGQQEVVTKSLGQMFQRIQGLAGGTILGDGRVGLILDLAGLFVLSERRSEEPSPPPVL